MVVRVEPTSGVRVDRRPSSWWEPAAVAAGSVVGASARWAVTELADIEAAANGAFPWHTLGENVLGCLLIGLFAVRLTGVVARGFVVTGMLGGFTTMSAFAVETNDLADAGRTDLAVAYVLASIAAGLAATWIGERSAARPGTST